MIMNSGSSTVTTVGEVQENQISIDQRNIEHLITILSSNLYSHPEQSFLREIVSNAIDAQVEANSGEPAIISIAWDSASANYVIAIRDYGTGISPERFKDIYLNIGSSTKRESNDYIGSFGIGRFSALACADMVHITSYYEGTQYQYVMLKNGSKINVDLLDTHPTNERNGVEVKIKVDWYYPYTEALSYLWFIPNVYVHLDNLGITDLINRINSFNDRKLYYFENFAYNNTPISSSAFVLLGNILYPLDTQYIPSEIGEREDIKSIWCKCIPRFEIGDLDITPNREQLLYSDKTIKALNDKFIAAANELRKICNQISQKSFTNIFEYHAAVAESTVVINLPNDDDVKLPLSLSKKTFLREELNFTYKDDDMAKDSDIRQTIANIRYHSITDIFDNELVFADGSYLTQKRARKSSYDVKELLARGVDVRIMFVPTMEMLKSDIFKSYLNEKVQTISATTGKEVIFVLTSDKPTVKGLLRNDCFRVKENMVTNIHKSIWLLRELKEAMKKHFFVYDVVHSQEFVEYRRAELEFRKSERKKAIKFTQNTRFYLEGYKKGGWSYENFKNAKIDVKDTPELVRRVKSVSSSSLHETNIPIYWGVREDPYIDIWKKMVMSKHTFIIVTVAKTNAKYLENAALPKNWQHITSDFILNSRTFRRYITSQNNAITPSPLGAIDIMRNTSDRPLVDGVLKVKDLSPSGLKDKVENPALLQTLEESYHGYYDLDMLESYALIDKYNRIAQQMKGIIHLSEGEVTPLVMYAAMKRKIVRPRWEVYQRINSSLKPNIEESNEKVD